MSLWFAAVGAIVTAFTLGYVAHYDFGIARQEICLLAVTAAAVIGLPLAIEFLGKGLLKSK
jgi:hypothetical protein